MRVTTSGGFEYTYNPVDNSIVDGEVANIQDIYINFKPLDEISQLSNVSSFTIGVTEQCNFRCAYCCYSGKYSEHRTHSPRKISADAIPTIIEFMVRNSHSDLISVDFYGGESLLEFDWIQEFVDAARTVYDRKWTFELSTNGLLLTRLTADWLMEHDFKIFVSVDGIGGYHDRSRKDVMGNNTFSEIYKNLTYIREQSEVYWRNNVRIIMTVPDISDLPGIAQGWMSDPILRENTPYRISEVSTIYDINTSRIVEDTELDKYMRIVEWVKENPDNDVIRIFFSIWLAEWIDRPIARLDNEVEYPTCVPHNRKLYIDANGNIGLCERISDSIRIGSVIDGIDYRKVNDVVAGTAEFIRKNCSSCEISRICDICPDVLRIPEELTRIYCHNQRTLQRIKFRCFCELAESEII